MASPVTSNPTGFGTFGYSESLTPYWVSPTDYANFTQCFDFTAEGLSVARDTFEYWNGETLALANKGDLIPLGCASVICPMPSVRIGPRHVRTARRDALPHSR